MPDFKDGDHLGNFFRTPDLAPIVSNVETIANQMMQARQFIDVLKKRGVESYMAAVELAQELTASQGRGNSPKRHRDIKWFDPDLSKPPYEVGRSFYMRSKNELKIYEPEPWLIEAKEMTAGVVFENQTKTADTESKPDVKLSMKFEQQSLVNMALEWKSHTPHMPAWELLYLSEYDHPDPKMNALASRLGEFPIPFCFVSSKERHEYEMNFSLDLLIPRLNYTMKPDINLKQKLLGHNHAELGYYYTFDPDSNIFTLKFKNQASQESFSQKFDKNDPTKDFWSFTPERFMEIFEALPGVVPRTDITPVAK